MPASPESKRRAIAAPELLICLVILATLFAVAVPRWQRAYTARSVAQATHDLDEMYRAVLAYQVDTGSLPLQTWRCLGRTVDFPEGKLGYLTLSIGMTTPVAYLSSLRDDTLLGPTDPLLSRKYTYAERTQLQSIFVLGSTCPLPPGSGTATPPTSMDISVFNGRLGAWAVMSAGPDGTIGSYSEWTRIYDPTNGSTLGNIVRSPLYPPQQVVSAVLSNWGAYE